MLFLDRFQFGGLLADEMGLGKTVQILAFLDYKKSMISVDCESKRSLKTLLIVPKSLEMNWYREATKYSSALKVKNIYSTNIDQLEKYAELFDVLIISYGLVRRRERIISSTTFYYIIIDEAQIIKNRNSQISRIIKGLLANNRLAITGTPIENHIGEILSIFEFLNPKQMLSSVIESESSEESISVFFNKLRPFILRRVRSDVLTELPPKNENIVMIKMTRVQQEIYDHFKKYYQEKLNHFLSENKFYEHRIFFLEGLLRLRQISCHPSLLKLDCSDYLIQLNSKDVVIDSNKINLFLETIVRDDFLSEHKILVFSQFTSLLSILREELDCKNIPYEYLDGQTKNRQIVVDNFQKNKEIKIFLIGIKSGGLGINLTSADYCFILDPWWNPAVEKQAIDRIYRLGQNREVFVYKYISEGSVEEKILNLHQFKMVQAEYLKSSEESFFNNLSAKDFNYLFS